MLDRRDLLGAFAAYALLAELSSVQQVQPVDLSRAPTSATERCARRYAAG